MIAAFALDTFDAELIHFSSIASEIGRSGYTVTIFHLSHSEEPAITSLLTPEIEINELYVTGKTKNILFIRGVLATPIFLHILKLNRPDIVYARLGVVTGIYILAAKLVLRNKIKFITEHNGWIGPEAASTGKPQPLVWIGTMVQKWAARCSDKVRAVSDGVKSYLVSLGVDENKISVIGNGTDTDHFKPEDITPRYDIGFVGNLAKWQGVEWLIEAIVLVQQTHPDITGIIVGSGPEGINLNTQIHNSSAKNLKMLGALHYQSVPNIINSCKICIAPFKPRGSTSDNKSISPLKIRDYAACGKPIIASRIPGLEEVETAEFGILVEPGDTQALAQAIIRLLDNPSLRANMGKNAREYAVKNYAWSSIAAQISQEIESLFKSAT